MIKERIHQAGAALVRDSRVACRLAIFADFCSSSHSISCEACTTREMKLLLLEDQDTSNQRAVGALSTWQTYTVRNFSGGLLSLLDITLSFFFEGVPMIAMPNGLR